MEFLGLIGGLLFVLATLNQTIKCVRTGNADGLSKAFLWILQVGFACMITYVATTIGWDLALIGNYAIQSVLIGIILKYKYWPRLPEYLR